MTNKKLYSFNDFPEHKLELDNWTKKWIKNAMSTKQMDEEEKEICRENVKKLYEAANLTPPPPHRIVFVSSPFILRFAAGFASAIWYMREKRATNAATDDATDAATNGATNAATGAATDDATYAATDGATHAPTYAATYVATDAATDAATDDATRAATYDATRAATYDATRAATYAATNDATNDATNAATYAATDDAIYAATYAATYVATDAATDAATDDATRAATYAATDDAIYAATYTATDDAIYAATYTATNAATNDATYAAAEDATYAAADDASSWFKFNLKSMIKLDKFFKLGGFGLRCAVQSYMLWQGGNQWSSRVAFLSFFRHVSKLDIDYSKFDAWEKLTKHSGPRIVHKRFCIISDRPSKLLVDSQNRPHCEDGAFCEWRDGSALYSWHGTRVPSWIIENPEKITIEKINNETNLEIKRVMCERYGWEKYFKDRIEKGACKLLNEKIVWGQAVRLFIDKDGEIDRHFVHVINGTEEQDGSRHQFIINCKNIDNDAEKSVYGTYPELIEDIKRYYPKTWLQELRNSIRT
jgi:hypothetical protein